MITISIKHNFDRIAADLRRYARQVQFAAVKTCTDVARQAVVDVKADMPRHIEKPTPFTQSAIRWRSATKARPSSTVYIAPIAAKYLGPLIEGGTSRPTKGKALVLPGADRLNQYGNIPRTRIKTLLRQRNTFAGTVKGISGIWKRVGGRLELLIRFESAQKKPASFHFPDLVRKSVDRHWDRMFRRNLDAALRTAR